MSSTGTPKYGLNQWQGSDKPKREDFNSDNKKIDAALDELNSKMAEANHTHNLATDVTGHLPLANMTTSATDNRVLRVGAANTDPVYAQVNLSTDVTGILNAANVGIDPSRLIPRPMTPNLNDWLPTGPTGQSGAFVGEGQNIINAPGTGWFRYIGIAHVGSNHWCSILAFDFSSDSVWVRRQTNGQWHSWTRLSNNSVVLPANTNLNDVTIPGRYASGALANAGTITNQPHHGHFSLDVSEWSGGGISQVITYSNSGRMFFRGGAPLSGNTWAEVSMLDANGRLPLANTATSATANRVLRVGAANSNPTWGQVNLGTDVTGQLPAINGILIPSGANLNDYITPGNYFSNTAGGFINSPIDAHFSLTVTRTANTAVSQVLQTEFTNPRIFTRQSSNEPRIWSSWREIARLDANGRLPLTNTATSGTANRVLRVGTANSNPVWGQVNLGTDVTGTLPSGNIGSHNHDAANINAGRLALARHATSGTANRVLRVGTANTDPVYGQVALGTDVSGQLPLGNAPRGAANTVLRGTGIGSNPAFGQVNLATDVTGTLPSGNIGSHNHDVANINTGRLALARHATSATANRVLRVGTANTDPTYGQVALGTDVSGRLPLANTATSATANRVLRVGAANSNPVWGQVNLGTDVTGTLANGNLPTGILVGSSVENITISPALSGITGIIRVQRITGSRMVSLIVDITASPAIPRGTLIFVLPVGFRPLVSHNISAHMVFNFIDTGYLTLNSNGNVISHISSQGAARDVIAGGSYLTT